MSVVFYHADIHITSIELSSIQCDDGPVCVPIELFSTQCSPASPYSYSQPSVMISFVLSFCLAPVWCWVTKCVCKILSLVMYENGPNT